MKIKQLKSISDTFDLQFPENKPIDVVGFGMNSIDHLCIVPNYPSLDSKTDILQYEMLPGGQAATTLTFLSRMGLKTKYIGKVGDDDLGKFSLKCLASESIDTRSVKIQSGARNQCGLILIDKSSGERTVLCHRDEKLNFHESELDKESICTGRILHLDGYDSSGALRAARWCHEQGIPVVIDLDKVVDNCRTLIKEIDFLIVSSNFPSDFTGIIDPIDASLALRNMHDGFLAVTLGNEGAMAWVGDRCVKFPGIKLSAIDTTGAGDIFHGGFIYGLLQNWPLEQTMKFANAAAGLNCLSLGARQGIRSLSEILSAANQLF
jgi:sulfofructose kinase